MIYFDHNATSPILPEIQEVMRAAWAENFGNPSSLHQAGKRAKNALDNARERLAALLGVQAKQVIFTSGGTESNLLGLYGLARHFGDFGAIWHPMTEHSAVREAAIFLQKNLNNKFEINNLSPNFDFKNKNFIKKNSNNILAWMAAHNETGQISNLAEIADWVRENDFLWHIDAVQAFGKLDLNFKKTGAHTMAIASHKVGGPAGVGALIVDKRVDLGAVMRGGGQEFGLRGGTENIAGILGFVRAAELACENIVNYQLHCQNLKNILEQKLETLGAQIFAQDQPRLANTSLFALPNVRGDALAMALDRAGFAVATGSACSSGQGKPSASLLALGFAPEIALGAVRVSVGLENTVQEVLDFGGNLGKLLGKVRE